jgi:DNA-binding transcriptional regulator YhcF (GntR family)
MKVNITKLKKDFDRGLTYREMAFNQKISMHTVYYHLGRLGLLGRDRGTKQQHNTERQKELYDWVVEKTKKEGLPPSAKELGIHFDIAYQTAKTAMYRLYEKGLLEKGEFTYQVMKPTFVKRYYKPKINVEVIK